MVTLKLVQAGYRVVLLEGHSCLGAQSSTHNHGWLHHSGRFYLLLHGMEVVHQCQAGARELLALAPHCVEPRQGAYLVTAAPERAHRYIQRCHEVGLSPHEVSLKTLREREPALQGAPLQAAFGVSDRPFVPSVVLQVLYTAAVQAGAEVRCGIIVRGFRFAAGRIIGVKCQHNGSLEEIPTSFVVNAAGAWSRGLLHTAGLDVPDIRLFQSSLLVVEPPLTADRMLLSLDAQGATIVPHRTRTVVGVNGDARPLEAPEEMPSDHASRNILIGAVGALLPTIAGRQHRKAFVWTCRKTEFVCSRTHAQGRSPAYAVLDHSAEGVSNLLTCLPGKFTTAPVMAAAVLSAMREKLPLPLRRR